MPIAGIVLSDNADNRDVIAQRLTRVGGVKPVVGVTTVKELREALPGEGKLPMAITVIDANTRGVGTPHDLYRACTVLDFYGAGHILLYGNPETATSLYDLVCAGGASISQSRIWGLTIFDPTADDPIGAVAEFAVEISSRVASQRVDQALLEYMARLDEEGWLAGNGVLTSDQRADGVRLTGARVIRRSTRSVTAEEAARAERLARTRLDSATRWPGYDHGRSNFDRGR